ncbi:MAG: hypothetical protein NWQ38_05580 [Cellulophaga sp.]|nr:hypothetical protein [Cellulophaga sp.]
MKNILLVATLVFTLTTSYSQEGFKIGVQGGIPFNDFNDEVGVVLGANAGYMWALNEVIDLGIMAGYTYGFPEKFGTEDPLTDLPSVQFVPLALSARIWPSNSFSFGVDVGQALGLNEGNEGGLYYRPQVGFLMGAFTELNISYSAIVLEEKQFNTLTLGILFTIPSKRSF